MPASALRLTGRFPLERSFVIDACAVGQMLRRNREGVASATFLPKLKSKWRLRSSAGSEQSRQKPGRPSRREWGLTGGRALGNEESCWSCRLGTWASSRSK